MLEAPLLAHLFRAGLVQQLAHAFGPVEGIVWTCRWVWFTERLFSAILQMRFGEGKMALEPTAPVRTSQRAAAISVIVFAAIESPEIEPFEIATSAAAAGAAPLTD